MEISQGNWIQCQDFTESKQASLCSRHVVTGPGNLASEIMGLCKSDNVGVLGSLVVNRMSVGSGVHVGYGGHVQHRQSFSIPMGVPDRIMMDFRRNSLPIYFDMDMNVNVMNHQTCKHSQVQTYKHCLAHIFNQCLVRIYKPSLSPSNHPCRIVNSNLVICRLVLTSSHFLQ